MGFNILTAILNIASFKENDLKDYATRYLIKINAVGDRLEFYIQDAIANTFEKKLKEKEKEYGKIFSYQGSQNHPPDTIIKQGDAFEVKKIGGIKSSIHLNSSPPKRKLLRTDKRLTVECKNCEEWDEKTLFYVIGSVQKNVIKYLFFVEGECYAADHSIYESLHEPLKEEIDTVLKNRNLISKETVELGGVEKVDPLGITSLRIRGMWNMKNPLEFFKEKVNFNENKNFSLITLMTKERYYLYPEQDIKQIEENEEISIKDIQIIDPNDSTKEIEAKLISFSF